VSNESAIASGHVGPDKEFQLDYVSCLIGSKGQLVEQFPGKHKVMGSVNIILHSYLMKCWIQKKEQKNLLLKYS